MNTKPEVTEADIDQRFESSDNVGVLDSAPLGLGYLADFDLDYFTVAPVVELDQKRPCTPATFGRKGKPLSHTLFEANECLWKPSPILPSQTARSGGSPNSAAVPSTPGKVTAIPCFQAPCIPAGS